MLSCHSSYDNYNASSKAHTSAQANNHPKFAIT